MIGRRVQFLKPLAGPRIGRVCMQCMLNAMAATAGATGARSWLGAKKFSWLTPRRLRIATIVLVSAALFASATLVSGTSAPRPHRSAQAHAAPAAPAQPER
jgi:hypothetical protein